MRQPLRDIAAAQHGAFTTAQALRCYSRGELRALLHAGRWAGVFTGTYRVKAGEPSARLRLVRLRCGALTTTADRTAIDLARTLPRIDVLPVLDAALAAGACTPESPAGELERHTALRGVRQARELVPLADPAPESPQESRLRLRCHDAGLPPPALQLPILDTRDRPCRWLDLAWEKVKVGLEYDGEDGHTGRQNLRSDRRRHNFLQDDGWAMFYATDIDVYRDHDELMRKVGAAIERRSRRLTG
jgi:hypothetical protein